VDFVALTLENAARPPLGKDKNQLLDNACLEFYLIFCNSSNRPRVCKTPTRTVAMISEDFIAKSPMKRLSKMNIEAKAPYFPKAAATTSAIPNKQPSINARLSLPAFISKITLLWSAHDQYLPQPSGQWPPSGCTVQCPRPSITRCDLPSDHAQRQITRARRLTG